MALQQRRSLDAYEITLPQRMVSATFGLVAVLLVVTPLDIIRIRIQQQQLMDLCGSCSPAKSTLPAAPSSRPVAAGSSRIPDLFWSSKLYCSSALCTRIDSTWSGAVQITRNEGLRTLWRGLMLTLVMAVPLNVLYYGGYEYIRDQLPFTGHPLNPLLCGLVARTVLATFILPMELLKTRFQAVPSEARSLLLQVMRDLATDIFRSARTQGPGFLFTGLGITLWRDVPFSGIYWFSYEHLKPRVTRWMDMASNSVFVPSFLSGSIAGSVAAIVTHPFDVGKTRMQIAGHTPQRNTLVARARPHPLIHKYLVEIVKTEGVGALYAGWAPRVMKVAPACAIMILTYEVAKTVFGGMDQAGMS